MRQAFSLLVAALLIEIKAAYVTSPSYLPYTRQVAWLQEMTVDICQAKPGQLSHSQLRQAPELMQAWTNVKQRKDVISKKACALHVESLVKRVIDEQRAGNQQATPLQVADYNCLLTGWARSGQGVAAAERCEQILQAMQQQGPQPDRVSFKATLLAWRQMRRDDDDNSNNNNNMIPFRAQRLLEWMLAQDKEELLPDADCFDMVLQIWSRSGHPQAPEQTEQLLCAMERLSRKAPSLCQPRPCSFNAVLAAWAKSGRPEAAERAVAILAFLQQSPVLSPDAASYNTVMGALARQKSNVRAADAVLQQAEDEHRKDPSLKLDTILFNTVMGAWSKSKQAGAYRKARSILDRQVGFHQNGCETCEPDVVGYTSVIASCAAEKEERSKAWQVAWQTYQEMGQEKRNRAPNHVTYSALLKACTHLLPSPSERSAKVSQIFRDCCAAGCVSDMVLGQLREATASPALYKKLTRGHGRKNIPVEWSRHVVQQKDRRGKKRRRAEV